MDQDNDIYRRLKEMNPEAPEEKILQSVAEIQALQKSAPGPSLVEKGYGYAQKGLDWMRENAMIPALGGGQHQELDPPRDNLVRMQIPSTPTQALVMGATGPAGRIASGAGAGATALRSALPMAVGGVSGALDPESTATRGMTEGVIPGAVEGGLRTAAAAKYAASRLGTSVRSKANADKVADDLVAGVSADMEKASGGTIPMGPAFAGAGNSASKLAEFPARVGKALRAGFDTVERNIAGTAGEMNLPALAQSDPTRAGKIVSEYVRMAQARGEDPQALQALVNLVQTNPQAVIAQALRSNPELANYTPKEAMKALKDAAFAAREANPSTPGFTTRQVDRGVHEEFTAALAGQGHGNLATEFNKVSKGYWLGKKLEGFLAGLAGAGFFKNPEVRGAAGTSATVNPQGGRDFATRSQDQYGRVDMPQTQGALFQGQPTGAANMMRDFAGGLFPSFTRFPALGSGSIGVQIPRFRLQENVGQVYPRTPGRQSIEQTRQTSAGMLPMLMPSTGVE